MKVVRRYSMSIGNGFRFHTKDRATGKKTQNSGVMVKVDIGNVDKEYYGVLEHVYELSYVGNKKIYLFKCHWWDVDNLDEGYKVDKHGFTSINTQYALETDEPFILSSQVEQVFYVDDIDHPDWLVVIRTNPRDLFNMLSVNNEDADRRGHVTTFDEDAYQQLVVDLNINATSLDVPDIFIDLGDDVVPPQTSMEAGAPSHRSMYNTMEFGFIDDSQTHLSSHEDNDEEDVLDDSDSDSEEESDTNDEMEESDSEDIHSSDNFSEESIE